VALLLAAMGIVGILSQAVTERRRETGIRMALGAGSARLVRLLVGRGVGLAALAQPSAPSRHSSAFVRSKDCCSA
jgi:ABC-type antimicrobial peptide transport system permease subunit